MSRLVSVLDQPAARRRGKLHSLLAVSILVAGAGAFAVAGSVAADDSLPVSTDRSTYTMGVGDTILVSASCTVEGTVAIVLHQARAASNFVASVNSSCSGGTAGAAFDIDSNTNFRPGTYGVLAFTGGYQCCEFSPSYSITVNGPPETTAPETTAPETTAPGTTAPGTTAPETTAPGTTAPGTTAPATTIVPGAGTGGPAIGTNDGNDIELRGRSTTFTGTGFEPGEAVTGTFHSDPIALGTQLADASGTVRFEFVMPRDIALGAHRIVMVGERSGTVEMAITVAADASSTAGSAGAAASGGAAVLPMTR